VLMGGLGVGLVRLVGGEVRGGVVLSCCKMGEWDGGVVEILWWDSWILVSFLGEGWLAFWS
jgi:hypothetical protein